MPIFTIGRRNLVFQKQKGRLANVFLSCVGGYLVIINNALLLVAGPQFVGDVIHRRIRKKSYKAIFSSRTPVMAPRITETFDRELSFAWAEIFNKHANRVQVFNAGDGQLCYGRS